MKIVRKLVAITALSAMVLVPTGCNQQDVAKTVALVESQLPTAIALTNTVLSVLATSGVLASDQQNNIGTVVTQDLTELQTLCTQYEAGANKGVFDSIVSLVDKIVTEGDASLLQAAQIKDPQTKATVTAALGALDTVLHIIDGYVQLSQSTQQVKAEAARRQVKLQSIHAYLDPAAILNGARKADPSTVDAMLLNDPSGATVAATWLQHEQALGF